MSQHIRSANIPRLVFLGHPCAAAAATLAALVETTGVGAMPASASPAFPAARRTARNASANREHSRRTGPGDALAGIAPTDPGLKTIQDHALQDDCQIVRIILAGAPGARPGDLEQLAARNAIPLVWAVSAQEATAALRAAAPDVAVAACFPWRLPRAARQIPPLGILNIHPSLLPAGRGPWPVFWTLRRGEQTTGVTVHRMDAGFDTGPIVARAEMPVAPGVRAPDLEQALMALGGALLLDALPALAAGALQPRPQPATGASEAPVPAAADWTMVASLPAAWAWRFARGVAPLEGPLTALAGGVAIPVADALAWSPDERLPQPIEDEGDGTVRVRFSPGWVRFRRR